MALQGNLISPAPRKLDRIERVSSLATVLPSESLVQTAVMPGRCTAESRAPLFDAGLMLLDADVTSKTEVIKLVTDRLLIAGRIKNPRQLEVAFWQREMTGSTGFGDGFAIPHCRSGTITVDSLVIIRPRLPLRWGSSDDQPVEVIIALVIRETEAGVFDMKIMAGLARLVMQSDFCQKLKTESDPEHLVDWLKKKLSA
jgi:multiphosphoryl transfer protein